MACSALNFFYSVPRKSSPSSSKTAKKKAAHPNSTGGVGFQLEQYVGAYYLAVLLMKSAPRGHGGGELVQVRFQRRFVDDEPMDDLILWVKVPDAPTGKAKLSLQIKHNLSWGGGESNLVFPEVMRACWETLRQSSFQFGFDLFGIVLGQNKATYAAYHRVIAQARSTSSAKDFLGNVEVFESASCRTFRDLVRSQLEACAQADNDSASDEDLWKFFRSLVLLPFDLLEPDSELHSSILTHLQLFCKLDATKAKDLWNRLLVLAANSLPNAATFDREDLIRKLRAGGFVFPKGIFDERPSNSVEEETAKESGSASLNAAVPVLEETGVQTRVNAPLRDDQLKRVAQEAKLDARVDEARKLADKGRAQEAREILLEVRGDLSVPHSAELSFRLAAHLGFCAFELDEVDEAIREYEKAFRSYSQHPKGKATSAQAALLAQRWDEAARLSKEVLESEPRYSHAVLIFIQSLFHGGKIADLEAYLEREPWIEDDPSCALVLAEIKAGQGQRDEAIALLEKQVSDNAKEPEVASQLAFHLVERAREHLQRSPSLLWRLPQAVRNDIKKALDYFGRSIALWEKHDNRRHLLNDLANRSAAHMMNRNHEAALRDLNRVLGENPENALAQLNKGYALLQLRKFSEAVEMLLPLRNGMWRKEAVRSLVAALMQEGKYDEALEELDTLLNSIALPPELPGSPATPEDTSLSLTEFFDFQDLKLNLLHELGRHEQAWQERQRLEEQLPDSADKVLLLSREQMWDGHWAKAIAMLRAAHKDASGNERDRLATTLAETFYQRRRFAAAIRFYREVLTDADLPAALENPGCLRRYVDALARAQGTQGEALRLCRAIRQLPQNGGKAVAFFSQTEAVLAQDAGDYELAIRLRRELAALEPNQPIHRLEAALMRLRSRDIAAARQELESIDDAVLQGRPELMMAVAKARGEAELPRAVHLAFLALRASPLNPQLHVDYTFVLLQHANDDDPALHPTEVRAGCSVSIEIRGQNEEKETIKWLLVEGEAKADDELSVADPRAQELLGRRVGQTVTVKRGLMGEVQGVITEVLHRFVYAFHDSSYRFKTGQIVHPSLDAGTVGNPEEFLEKQKLMFSERLKYWETVAALYRKFALPLSSIAQAQGCPILDIWENIGSLGGRFFVTEGSAKVSQHEQAVLRRHFATQPKTNATNFGLVLDSTAICTLLLLSLEELHHEFAEGGSREPKRKPFRELLAQRFGQLVIPQPVWDEWHGIWLRQLREQGRSLSFGHDGHRFHLVEVPEKERERQRFVLQKALGFLEAHTQIKPVYDLISLPHAQRRLLGKSTMSAILLSRELRAPLWSDDLRVRGLAKSQFQVPAVSVYGILSVWSEQQPLTALTSRAGAVPPLSRTQIFGAWGKLMARGYSYLPLNYEVLLDWIRHHDMAPQLPVRAALRTMLSGDLADQEHAAGIAADLLVALRREGLLHARREALHHATLQAYAAHRSTEGALKALLDELQNRLLLEPVAFEDLRRALNAWARTQIQAVNRSDDEVSPIKRPEADVVALFRNPLWRFRMEEEIEKLRS